MTVVRVRTRRDTRERDALETVVRVLHDATGADPSPLLGRLAALAERGLSAQSGWEFVMVEPRLYADVVAHLRRHSSRPMVAMELFTRLFSYLPPDGNEVEAGRAWLAARPTT